MQDTRPLIAVLILQAALLSVPTAVLGADSYPSQPMRLLVPNPPGGGSDAVARVLGMKMTDMLGQQIVVDNRAGAGGIIANETVARATPDGYTMLLAFIGPVVISPALMKTPYDSVKDFVPVSLVAAGQYMMSVHPSVPVKTVPEFVKYAKSRSGKLNYASAGPGSPLHLAAELFKQRAGVDMVHVPYKGGGPAVAAALAGEVQVIFGSITGVIPQVKAGKLVALGATGSQRSALAPDYPTIAEQGFPGFEMTSWYGILLPARTPHAIVAKLHDTVIKALKAPDVVEQLRRQGLDAIGSTPEAFGAHIKRELAKWDKVVKEAGIKVE